MEFKVNKEFVYELVKNHVLLDNGIDEEECYEISVIEKNDLYIVDIKFRIDTL